MARISRKELKKDEFVQEVTHTVEYVQTHRQPIVLWSAVVGGLLLVVLGSYLLWNKRNTDASDSISRALRTFHGTVLPAGAPPPQGSNEKFYASDKEKYTTSLQEFQAIAGKYSMLKHSDVARYYIGLCQLQLGNAAEGQKELTALAEGKNAEIGSLARFALASALVTQNKLEEAEKHYRYLIEHPTAEVPKTIAQMTLATHLRATKPKEAEKIYRELEQQQVSPKLQDMAKRMLAELKQ